MKTKPIHLEAISWVLLSTAIFTAIFATAKFADGAVGTFQIIFLRYIGSFMTLMVLVCRTGGLAQYKSATPGKHFLRAVFGCSAAAAITWASAHMPIADASAIGMLYGVFTVVLGIVFLKEHVGTRQWAAVCISLAGAMIVMGAIGAFQNTILILPALVALLSAAFMASEGLLIRILSQTETALGMMLYISFFGILLMGIPAFAEWKAIGFGTYISCIALGPLSVLAQYCTIRGYRIAPLSVVGPVDYSWLIFATLLGMVLFDETPGLGALAGGALIVLGGIVLCSLRTQPSSGQD